MTPRALLNRLTNEGVSVTPKLRLEGIQPSSETLELITTHRDELLLELIGLNAVPRLPQQLERLLSAAASDVLPKGSVTMPSGLVTDLNRYALAWGSSYLIGDRTEALRRLWEAHRAWQGVN